MTAVAETPPKGLDAYWLGVWRGALKALKDHDTWAWEQRPLLDEYVYALRAAQNARASAKSAAAWDKHSKRALALADALALTPKAQKVLGTKVGGKDDEQDADPFSGLDDEVGAKRQAKARAG